MNRSVSVPSRPLKVNTQRHLGHALGGKAGNEAVAQVDAADVDVAPCRRRCPRGRRGSAPRLPFMGCGHCRLPSCICARRLSSCLAAPMGATSCPGLASKWILEPASLSQKVT